VGEVGEDLTYIYIYVCMYVCMEPLYNWILNFAFWILDYLDYSWTQGQSGLENNHYVCVGTFPNLGLVP